MDETDLSSAQGLLDRAVAAAEPQTKRLLMAAALRLVFERTPVVVGGTAEEHWLSEEYQPTDLDLCPRPTTRDRAVLGQLGFHKDGRHWVRDDLVYGVEFPGDGDDIHRTEDIDVEGATVTVLGLEDLYLDRLRQATAVEGALRNQRFDSVVALRVVWWDRIDDAYIKEQIRLAGIAEPLVGPAMHRLEQRAVKVARDQLVRLRQRGLSGPAVGL